MYLSLEPKYTFSNCNANNRIGIRVLRTNRFAGAKDLVERFCTVPADTVCLVVGNEHDVPPAERIGDHSEGKRRGIRLPMVTKTVGVEAHGCEQLARKLQLPDPTRRNPTRRYTGYP